MKSTTEQIKNLLAELTTLDSTLLIGITENRILNVAYQEVGLKESLDYFKYYRDILWDSIEKDPSLFERIVPYTIRTNLINSLSKLHSLVQQFKKQIGNIQLLQQTCVQIVAQISSIQQTLSSINFESYSGHAPNYYKKLNEIYYLNRRFKEIEQEADEIDLIYQNIKEVLELSQVVDKKLINSQKNAEETQNKLNAIQKDVESRYEIIKNTNNNLIEYEANAKSSSETISLFATEVDNYKTSMSEGLMQLKNSLSENKDNFKKTITEFEKTFLTSNEKYEIKTEKIVAKNTQLQQDILGILGKAIGTQLYMSFEQKAKSMKYISWIWLGGLVVSLVFLTIIGYKVVEELIIEHTPFDRSFYLRITVIFPIIYAVYFFASLFKTANKIKEEYDFKSAVSVSLHHFKEIIENSKDNLETQTFLKDSVHKIFSSPTEIVFGHKKVDQDINDKVESAVEKIVNLANSVISKK